MPYPESFYPPVSFSFRLTFGGEEEPGNIGFQEASGMNMEMNVEEVVGGGENRFKYRLPGVVRHNNLVLKRGLVTKNSTLYKWCKDTLENNFSSPIETKKITVALLDAKGDVLVSWDFINAYPVKWSVSDFRSMENSYAVESLEFAHNYFIKKE